MVEKEFYKTLAEASQAAVKLNISGSVDYQRRYREDPCLPSSPQKFYKSEWPGFRSFLSRKQIDTGFYANYWLAKHAVLALGVNSCAEYKFYCGVDPYLPPNPGVIYEGEWHGYKSFLADDGRRGGKYRTIAEASEAVRLLGIKTVFTYESGHKQDSKLPPLPYLFYRQEWSNWDEFLGRENFDPIEVIDSLEKAKVIVRMHGVMDKKGYVSLVGVDDRLPLAPNDVWPNEWQGWREFLGKHNNSGKYFSFQAAREAAREACFSNSSDYNRRSFKVDPRFPRAPRVVFAEDWAGWLDYLGSQRKKEIHSFEVARALAVKMGIRSALEYGLRYREDPLLPGNPRQAYAEQWEGWSVFLGRASMSGELEREYYSSWEMAAEAARRLGIESKSQYRDKYLQDPLLPPNPTKIYGNLWPGFAMFKSWNKELYGTIEEASEAAQSLGLKTKEEYTYRYVEDSRLSQLPNLTYPEAWNSWGWGRYLGTGKYTYREAGAVAWALGVYSSDSYKLAYPSDPRLPSAVLRFYKDEWKGWEDFLLPDSCSTLADVKLAIKIIGIKNSREYRDRYKSYSCLPCHPERVFSEEWIDWYDVCDTARPYTYEEACEIVRAAGVEGSMGYKSFIAAKRDPRLPKSPEETYEDKWISWYVFLGKKEPYKLSTIRGAYVGWRDAIEEFLNTSRAQAPKEKSLTKFVRDYIQKYELGFSPECFFTSERFELNMFIDLIHGQNNLTGSGILYAVREFADFFIRRKLTSEDVNTGELVVASNARNPFVSLIYEGSSKSNLGESNKPALAYQYVRSITDWMVPAEAESFSDLRNIQIFDADWIIVDPSVIDPSDPNCVYKVQNGKTKLWNPVYWMHTYALASVPARGHQLAYNDSGEADEEIPQVVGGAIVWVKNTTPLAGETKKQGFIKKYDDGYCGMHFTSNKTSTCGDGYDVAWIPEVLAIWMVRLRNWQAKYNPIRRVMPWVECARTDLNKEQLKSKGKNCFLFRDFGEEEAGVFGSRLATRLAAALYHSQPNSIVLAELNGNVAFVTAYTSKYTPHSMRVSLITAYIMEFGLPLDIVMKVAGHTSIVMSIYYVKLNAEGLRQKFTEGEKRALSQKVQAAIQMIEQNRIDEIRHELISNNEQALELYKGDAYPGSVLFRDYGFCPFAGSRCDDGGPFIGMKKVRQPVSHGYLGCQNCLRCRHFVSGPVFIGGLLALANEISLQSSIQFDQVSKLEETILDNERQIDLLDEQEYFSSKMGEHFDLGERNGLEMRNRKLRSEAESASKKADMFLTDLQAVSRLINQSQALLNEQIGQEEVEGRHQLIVQKDHELHVAFEEVSKFHQYCEVCENAEIYESASAALALAPRSQLIDRMAAFNEVTPRMFSLDSKQQLIIGNQLVKFFLHRVKSWDRLDGLMDGRIYLEDLAEHEKISRVDIASIMGGGVDGLWLEST